MLRCTELARLGIGRVSPNPMVGAVIVYEGRIIGEGYHEQFGGPHAEVNAINNVLEKVPNAESILKKSTLYVNLEPCAHFGKTPPCANLIIRYGLPEVVIGCRDPFEDVDGKGIERLREAGINVIVNILQAECEELNKRFFTRVNKQRPYIILKWAQTSNGFFAPKNGTQKWISSPLAKTLVHKWRSEEDSVLVGKNTAKIDNPQLTVREWAGRNPKRMIIDRNLELSKDLHLFDQTVETIVFNAKKTEVDGNIKYLELENFDEYLPQLICYQLYLMDIQSVIIEGGSKTLQLFINAGLWDEARIFTAPVIWGDGIKAPHVIGNITAQMEVGTDKLQIVRNSIP